MNDRWNVCHMSNEVDIYFSCVLFRQSEHFLGLSFEIGVAGIVDGTWDGGTCICIDKMDQRPVVSIPDYLLNQIAQLLSVFLASRPARGTIVTTPGAEPRGDLNQNSAVHRAHGHILISFSTTHVTCRMKELKWTDRGPCLCTIPEEEAYIPKYQVYMYTYICIYILPIDSLEHDPLFAALPIPLRLTRSVMMMVTVFCRYPFRDDIPLLRESRLPMPHTRQAHTDTQTHTYVHTPDLDLGWQTARQPDGPTISRLRALIRSMLLQCRKKHIQSQCLVSGM